MVQPPHIGFSHFTSFARYQRQNVRRVWREGSLKLARMSKLAQLEYARQTRACTVSPQRPDTAPQAQVSTPPCGARHAIVGPAARPETFPHRDRLLLREPSRRSVASAVATRPRAAPPPRAGPRPASGSGGLVIVACAAARAGVSACW